MGPISTDICELSNHFAAGGHEVVLVDLVCQSKRRVLSERIGVIELVGKPESWAASSTTNPILKLWRLWRNYYSYMRQLAARVDFSGFDIIHVHAAELAFLLQRTYGLGVVYTAHTTLWALDLNPGSGRSRIGLGFVQTLRTRVIAWIEASAVRRSVLTIGLGSYLKAAIPDARIEVIPNGIDLSAWEPIDRISARNDLGIPDGDFIVLLTGRIKHVKGTDVLLEAVRSLVPSLPGLRILIIGPLSGSFDVGDAQTTAYAETVIALSSGLPVKFLGFINNTDIRFRQHLAAADIFVVPSRFEAQGKVVLESLAMGTPVVGSATGGIPEMLSSDVGLLFPPGDSVALAACIQQLHDHPQHLADMRRAARQRVISAYTWKSVADRHLESFERHRRTEGRMSSSQ
jgi:glycosyltransferase involved in cell wall biosynthesis